MTKTATGTAARLKRAPLRLPTPDRMLARFDARHRPVVTALARTHPRLADLAVSFPGLLFSLACPRAGVDVRPAVAAAIAGASLSHVAALAGVPMWLRPLDPEMFVARLPALPDDPFLRRRIANHLPTCPADAEGWFHRVGAAARWGEADFVVWTARESLPAAPGPRKRSRRFRADAGAWLIRRMAVWAFFSKRPETVAHAHVDRPWHADMRWRAAEDACASFRSSLIIALELGDTSLEDMWFDAGHVDGYDFVPLLSAREISAEAIAMEHCLRGYGDEIGVGTSRIWSVRQGGTRVATVELCVTWYNPIVRVGQACGPRNGRPGAAVIDAIASWAARHGALRRPWTEASPRLVVRDTRQWRALFRPYWLARRRIPDWLPLDPTATGIRF
jgi:hypothetical protein